MPELRVGGTTHPGSTTPPMATTSAPSAPPARPAARKLLPSASDPTMTVPQDIQRWTARRRMALVLSVLKGEISEEDGARRHGLTVAEVVDWRDRVLQAAHNALRSRPRDTDAVKDDQIRRLRQKIGELVVDVDILKEALEVARSAHDTELGED
jgi:transposase-like protein